MSAALRYRAPPTLARFMRSNARVRAVVGPLGSGKSSSCCVELVRRAAEQRAHGGVRATRAVVIRNTYRELEDTTRKTFEQWVPGALGRWYEKDFTFVIDRKLEDGTQLQAELLFRALDKPEHVKKLLSLELTFAYINEARQVPKAIIDMLGGRITRYPAMKDGGPSWYGMWMDTNPWHTGHWGYKLFTKERPAGFELFEQPDALGPHAENLENLVPGYYQEQKAGKDTEWIEEYLRAKYPSHDRGSVYGHLLAALEARGAMLAFEHPTDSIFTVWDLGRADSTAIWFFRLRPSGVDVVDHYENHGQKPSHYFSLLEEWQRTKGYQYAKHWLPHDARAKTLTTERSMIEQVADRFGVGAVGIAPELSLADGIAAARTLLEGDIRFHPRCDTSPVPGISSGLEALRAYKYAWNETLQTYAKEPLHDWSSHSADSFRYLALVVKRSVGLMRSSWDARPPEAPRGPLTGEEWKKFSQPKSRGERIG